MFDKSLAWCGNVLLAIVLVLLCGNGAFADEVPDVREIQVPDALNDPEDVEVQPSGRISVPISGQGEARRFANLSAAPARLETGLIEIGDAKSLTVKLTHVGASGSDPVGIGAVRIEGKDASEYASDFGGDATLYPGDVQPITVTFTPQVPGAKSASLLVDVDGATAPLVVFLGGESRFPLVSELEGSATAIGFGQIIQNGTVAKTLTLTNTGDPAAPGVFVSSILLGGDNPDVFQVDFVPQGIAPGQSIDVPILMSSGAEGTKNATVEIVHDGNNPTLELTLQGTVVTPTSVPVSFGASTLAQNVGLQKGTALQFGPDGKLYVAEVTGLIRVFDVVRNGKNNYQANQLETISLVKNVPNHDDDGTPNPGVGNRQVTGLHVVGTPGAPIIWVASSDPRHGAGPGGNDTGLDTNSGILHKLTKAGGGWQKQDVVRGLPRSEENHTPNGLVAQGGKVYLLSGGNTNQGLASEYFAELPEYALSAALLEIDVASIGGGTYDLPTLDSGNDGNDPFGGDDGKNQAKLVAGGPVQVFSSGLRNAYDLVLSQAGKLYTFDNGPNAPWGGTPNADCADIIKNGGDNQQDNLHLLTKGSYAGHPVPVRGNKANTFDGQSPVEIEADPRQCQYLAPGEDGSLTSIGASTNGLVEYTASNFAGSVNGDLLATTWNNQLYRLKLSGGGDGVTSKSVLADNVGSGSLGLATQGDAGPFPGTIWITSYFPPFQITVLEPDDY